VPSRTWVAGTWPEPPFIPLHDVNVVRKLRNCRSVASLGVKKMRRKNKGVAVPDVRLNEVVQQRPLQLRTDTVYIQEPVPPSLAPRL